MKSLQEMLQKFRVRAEHHARVGHYAMETQCHESADVIAEAIRREAASVPSETSLVDRILTLKRSLADNSKVLQEAEAWATKLREENSAMRAREVFLSNQNSCLRDEVRTLREEIAMNRGRNECLMKELDEVAPFKWEYTPDGTGGGGLKYRKSYIPLTPADFSQIEGRLARTVAARGWALGASPPKRRSKFEVGQLVNVMTGGFRLSRVMISSVTFFTPEAPNGILGANVAVAGEECGVKYTVAEPVNCYSYRDREVWAWMLELCPSRYEGESSGQPETF